MWYAWYNVPCSSFRWTDCKFHHNSKPTMISYVYPWLVPIRMIGYTALFNADYCAKENAPVRYAVSLGDGRCNRPAILRLVANLSQASFELDGRGWTFVSSSVDTARAHQSSVVCGEFGHDLSHSVDNIAVFWPPRLSVANARLRPAAQSAEELSELGSINRH